MYTTWDKIKKRNPRVGVPCTYRRKHWIVLKFRQRDATKCRKPLNSEEMLMVRLLTGQLGPSVRDPRTGSMYVIVVVRVSPLRESSMKLSRKVRGKVKDMRYFIAQKLKTSRRFLEFDSDTSHTCTSGTSRTPDIRRYGQQKQRQRPQSFRSYPKYVCAKFPSRTP